MKVYIVTEGCYSDYHIEAVFDSYGKAVAYVEAKAGRYSDYQIETYDTESVQVAEEKRWFTVHREGGEWTVIEVEEPAPGDYTDVFHANEYSIDVVAKDKEQAIKIAQDKWAEYRAIKAGIV